MKVKKGEIFNSIQVSKPPRNTFDLTHQHCTTMDFADLVPICSMEAVPGDKFDISSETFIRLQPMITPFMHQCYFTVHYFFVPNRILWPGWEKFITGDNGNTSGLGTPAAPYTTPNAFVEPGLQGRRSLANYLGFEVDFATKMTDLLLPEYPLNALPFAAYQKIYLDYYQPRELNPNPQDEVVLNDGDNTGNGTLAVLRRKGWLRDYFTSALPYAQKGAAVDMPLGDVVLAPDYGSSAVYPRFVNDLGSSPAGDVIATPTNIVTTGDSDSKYYDPRGSLIVEPTTINDLRRSMRLQEWLEKNARAGTRYTESLRVHFDVISSDARLQRAEYITGVKAPIIVSQVLNTAGEEGGLPQGNMAGHGIGIANSYRDTFFCEEHGWVMGILSVTPKPSYVTGLHRSIIKRMDPLDYYWPEFANIGEQEIQRLEIQLSNPTDSTFGYVPRYSEYKYMNDRITGDFADSTPTDLGSLRSWVMQRAFGSGFPTATLGVNFINGDIKSVAASPFAVEDTPIMVQQLNKVLVSRPMPVYGTPTF